LEQRRVDGCQFDVGVFTNLTRDHLDYHGTMESYLASKQRLFAELLVPNRTKPRRVAVVNLDDPYAAEIAEHAACPVIGYGIGGPAQVTAKNVRFSGEGIAATLATPKGEIAIHSLLLGRFNLSNILAAAAVGIALDLPLEAIRDGIEGHKNVPGRLERVANDRGVIALVDYAHTGDALENVLKTVQEFASGRIITVFGCGGDRDRGKRPIMGEIAGRLSDLAVITSDNPRSEEPQAIISEVRAGILPLGLREYTPAELAGAAKEKGFVTVVDRREAIRLAARVAQAGDVLLLAGKGHEDYQILGQEKHHFDDREEAALALR
jgi:UDP-N-acetylmuramoyl-L-alanyl-D-glutamate--2,6-diaminopimelate ligase